MSDQPDGLLIIWHSATGANRMLAQAAFRAACAANVVPVHLLSASLVQPHDLLRTKGFLFVCPEMLGGLPGPMKSMFDACFYPLLGRIEGRPYGVIIGTGTDGSGVERQIDRIANGWRLRRVIEPLRILNGAQTPQAIAAPKIMSQEALKQAAEIGSAFAHALALGVW